MEEEIWSDLVHNLILRRKRSQRQRPFGASSSSEDDVGDHVTPSSSEEHQAAKCLMLLARGVYDLNENFEPNEKKRKISGGLYECKTCNRAFPSFQALGGHRTSHKKIKIKTEQLLQQKSNDASHIVPRTALQLESSSRTAAAKARIHECLICGAEFASGQALGGHMRRHRVTVAVNSPTETTPRTTTDAKSDGITLSLFSPVRVETDEETGNEASTSNNNEFQCLDLNLPVSSSIGESQFSFGSKKPKQMQDSGLVFSSPALVDCNY